MMNSTLETDKSFFIKGIARFNWMFLFLYAAFPLIALEFLEWAASGRLSYYSKDSQSLSFAPAFGLIVFIAALNYLLSYWVHGKVTWLNHSYTQLSHELKTEGELQFQFYFYVY